MTQRLMVLNDEIAVVLTLRDPQQLQEAEHASRLNSKLFIRQVSMESTPSTQSEALQEEIRQRAHELYEERGREDGYAEQDWLHAETEVLARHRMHKVAEAA
jgi:DNA-binding transcriptional regulator GbsR (MarR family)